jgi:hypothetical protein
MRTGPGPGSLKQTDDSSILDAYFTGNDASGSLDHDTGPPPPPPPTCGPLEWKRVPLLQHLCASAPARPDPSNNPRLHLSSIPPSPLPPHPPRRAAPPLTGRVATPAGVWARRGRGMGCGGRGFGAGLYGPPAVRPARPLPRLRPRSPSPSPIPSLSPRPAPAPARLPALLPPLPSPAAVFP